MSAPIYSSDDDIYQAAAQAGYLPSSDSGSSDSGPVTSPDQVDDGRESTDQFIARMTQGNVNPATLPASAPVSRSVSSGQSSSGHGFDPTKYAQVSGTQSAPGGLNSDLAVADQAGAQEKTQETALLTPANTEARQAAQAVAKAGSGAELEKGRQAGVLAKLNDDFAAEEAKINEHYRAEGNQSKADYMAALADFRASKIDPDQLWKQGGRTGQVATLAAVFIHDFLGAKGIHTSAMDTLNHAIDRNIQAQEAEMRKKGQVAEGFKNLWEMQRAQSASDAEARTRVRGFLLDGAKQAVTSHMAQYESALATAQGQAAVAKIDEEFSKNLVDIYNHVDTNTTARRNQAIQIWGEKLRNAQESWANSIKQQEADRLKNAGMANPLQDLVKDQLTGRPIGQFNPGTTDKQKDEYHAKSASLKSAFDTIEEMRALVRNNPARPDGITGTRLSGTAGQQYDALASQVAQQIEYATDHRFSADMVKNDLKGFRPDTWLNQANSEKVIATVERNWLRQLKNNYNEIVTDLAPDDPRRNLAPNKEVPMGAALTETSNKIDTPPKTPDEKWLDTIQQGLGGPGAFEPVDSDTVGAEVKSDHKQFTQHTAARDLVNSRDPADDAWFEATTGKKRDDSGQKVSESNIIKYEQILTQARELAQKTDDKGAPTKEAKDATETLRNLALPYLSGKVNDDPISIYALMQLHELTTQEGWIKANATTSGSEEGK